MLHLPVRRRAASATRSAWPPTTRAGDALRLANPLSDDEPLLRTTLLPGLLAALHRNVGRGYADVALFETRPGLPAGPDAAGRCRRPGSTGRPTDEELAALDAALPRPAAPRRRVVLAGDREPAGWWGAGRPADWADAVEAARAVGRAAPVSS